MVEDEAVLKDVDLVDVRFSCLKLLVVAILGDVLLSITEESLVVASGLSLVALKRINAYWCLQLLMPNRKNHLI